ncbi:MAG TPA: M20/M25/M40 family metallo-hydrolase [Thermoanaerobaculia bacterium]|nr:M20/M25/M40 family metallo-hydrolase [Thermoanaerobaculia bacterium]HXT51486.1 M20/M25/M40 family metallo-hydrolase [Thermoanaerobaculia bacterium]
MTDIANLVDRDQAIGYLMRFLAVEGTTGHEGAIGEEIAAALRELDVPAEAIRFDGAERRIPVPTESGNLIADVAGDPSLPRRMFSAHRDTVPLCAGAKPVLQGDRVVPAGPTALGGDDRTGVACLLTMLAKLRRERLPHPPLTLVFTVREESGLWGARHLDVSMLGAPALAFNVDGSSADVLTIGAVGASRWEVEITGKAAHAGLHPEEGVSAPMVASVALTAVQRRGWFGRIRRKGGGAGTSNLGSMSGADGGRVGGPTNVVTDYVKVEGEARSHDERFVAKIVDAYRRAFEAAAQSLPSSTGARAQVAFTSRLQYHPFRLDEGSESVRFAIECATGLGLTPQLRHSDGGLDANWLAHHGIPAVTFGAGQRGIHSVDESVDIADYLGGCRLAVALARA